MRSLMKTALFLGMTVMLAACGGGAHHAARQPLTPMPQAMPEPSDQQLAAAVVKFLEQSDAPISSIFTHRRVDLNGDGRRDALVIFKNPYGYWCGLYGCTMLVMKAGHDDFELVSAVQPVREPLYISKHKTNGWNDIIIHVSGRWAEAKDVALQFDGKHYPNNPDSLPPHLRFAAREDTRLFYD